MFTPDVHEAFAILESGRTFDVVLCDLTMPAMSGPDVFDALVARWPELASHLIFMTGGAFTERARMFLQETKRPVLPKPFTAAELIELVAEQLKPAGGR